MNSTAMSLRDLFHIELPIIQAPMAGVQGSALAIAVSEAGGLGSLPCAMLSLSAMESEIQAVRAQTHRPFNVNFFCHQPPAANPERDQAWRESLAPYYAELGLNPADPVAAASRLPFNRDMADLICAYRPPVVSFHFGLPASELVEQVRSSGAKIVSSATTVDEALWLESQGVDAVIAQGLEAGGHRGMFLTTDLLSQVGTMALLPQMVRALKIPVIAAGGIADAAGVKAAMTLGASGVQVGTAYLLSPEANTSTVHRRALQAPSARITALTNIYSGRPARGIVNRLMREMGPINPRAPEFPLAAAASAPLRTQAESLGSGDFTPLWAGQNVSGCVDLPAGEITRALARLV